MLLTVLAESNHHLLYLGQRIWRGNIIFPDVEPKAVRHIMSCLLHSMSLWNRNCKCSNGHEQVMQSLINPKAAQTPGLRFPQMSCTKFTQHPQPSGHYKRHPLSLTGYKLYRGNLRATGISIYLDIPATSTTANLDAATSRPCLQNSCNTRQDKLPWIFQDHHPTPQAFPQQTLTKTINWWMRLDGCEKWYTHKE